MVLEGISYGSIESSVMIPDYQNPLKNSKEDNMKVFLCRSSIYNLLNLVYHVKRAVRLGFIH